MQAQTKILLALMFFSVFGIRPGRSTIRDASSIAPDVADLGTIDNPYVLTLDEYTSSDLPGNETDGSTYYSLDVDAGWYRFDAYWFGSSAIIAQVTADLNISISNAGNDIGSFTAAPAAGAATYYVELPSGINLINLNSDYVGNYELTVKFMPEGSIFENPINVTDSVYQGNFSANGYEDFLMYDTSNSESVINFTVTCTDAGNGISLQVYDLNKNLLNESYNYECADVVSTYSLNPSELKVDSAKPMVTITNPPDAVIVDIFAYTNAISYSVISEGIIASHPTFEWDSSGEYIGVDVDALGVNCSQGYKITINFAWTDQLENTIQWDIYSFWDDSTNTAGDYGTFNIVGSGTHTEISTFDSFKYHDKVIYVSFEVNVVKDGKETTKLLSANIKCDVIIFESTDSSSSTHLVTSTINSKTNASPFFTGAAFLGLLSVTILRFEKLRHKTYNWIKRI